MLFFRLWLVLMLGAIAAYTVVVGAAHGWNLLPVFFGDIAAMNWPGQFNFDFLSLLLLSGLWVAWRHSFSAAGLMLGLVAVFGGGLFLSAYLLVASLRARGDMAEILLGPGRAAQRP